MRYIYIFLFFGLICNICYPQNYDKIDSLRQATTSIKNDSTLAGIYSQIFNEFLYTKQDSAKNVLEELNGLAEISEERFSKVRLFNLKGTYQSVFNDKDSAVHFYQLSNQAAGRYYPLEKLDNLLRISMIRKDRGQLVVAEKNLLNALKIADSLNHFEFIIRTKRVLANIYLNQPDKAQKIYIEMIEAMEKSDESPQLLANIYLNFGEFYYDIMEFEKSAIYISKCKKLCEEIKFDFGVFICQLKLGYIMYKQNKLDSALVLSEDAYNFFKEKNIANKQIESLINLGLIHEAKNDFKTSEELLKKGYDLAQEIASSRGVINTSNELSDLYLANNMASQALFYAKKAHESAYTTDFLGLQKNSEERLSNVYGLMADYESAYRHHVQFKNLADSVLNQEQIKSVEELEAKYQGNQKEQEIELLKAQNLIAEQEKGNQLLILISLLSVILLVAIFLYFLYRNKQKIAQKLGELDKVKSNFFANISHEFRTPLTLIKSPLEVQLSSAELKPEERSQLESIDRNADRLLSLVDQLLDLSKLESGGMKLRVECSSLSAFLTATASSFEYLASQKNISFDYDFQTDDRQVWFDKDVMEKVMVNLISNAMKYTPENGKVFCALSFFGTNAKVKVRNTDDRLNEENICKVFERFYQADDSSDGAGIGLALVKELAELHHGKVDCIKLEDGMIEFFVDIPIDKKAYHHTEIKMEADSQTQNSTTLHEEVKHIEIEDPAILSDNPIMLIVEDNSELRNLVCDLFKKDYTILEAENGELGIEKAIQYIPDIIISDVMMPIKDGIELSQALRTDERTSHIPIILLTAKAGEENVITGFETGVDDYIVKPFSNEILRIRVQKLVELRAQLRQRYSQEVVLRPKDIAVSSTDEKFLERLQILLDERLIDPSFNSEIFSKEIGMSRMQLHRKLKALVGLTTTEFIRSQRLKLAAHLLESSEINMSEVGYSVGFNDPSYFSKCFKEAYDCTPKQYALINKPQE